MVDIDTTAAPAIATRSPSLLELTADVTAAYLSNNPTAATDIAGVVRTVHDTLANLGREPTQSSSVSVERASAAAIRKSITPENLISFEDGRPYRMLRRHLKTLGLTPEQYRAKWGLPADYPMTAPAYSEQRAALARSIGLGVKTGGRAARKVVDAAKQAPAKAAALADAVTGDGAKRRGPGRPRKVVEAVKRAPAKAAAVVKAVSDEGPKRRGPGRPRKPKD
ncbi:MAG TPA: MucR family transcriptional regulator [Caulobacteraceae bacterium]|nr:MucR family transcriptional regulator [Caulobacteraceae bacterium]